VSYPGWCTAFRQYPLELPNPTVTVCFNLVGALLAVTGGLAAPAIAGAIAVMGSSGAAAVLSVSVVATLCGSAGAGKWLVRVNCDSVCCLLCTDNVICRARRI
jgi:hypothetical protein